MNTNTDKKPRFLLHVEALLREHRQRRAQAANSKPRGLPLAKGGVK